MLSRFTQVAFAATTLALALPTTAFANETIRRQADLQVGPFIGGQDIFVDLRTQEAFAPAALIFSFSGTPTTNLGNPSIPALGLNAFAPGTLLKVRNLDATGRDLIQLPTSFGFYGSMDQSLPTFMQYIVQPNSGPRFLSNVASVEIEPSFVFPGLLADDGPARLPADFNTAGGDFALTADVNRDGFDDLVLANEVQVRFWINDGLGNFTDDTATRFTQTGEAVGPIAMADINNDSYLDLIVGGGFDDFDQIADRQYLNDGNGAFVLDAGGMPNPSGLSNDFEFGDVDNDGDLDMIVTSGEGVHLSIPGGVDRMYFNDGNGNWTESPNFAGLLYNDGMITSTAGRFADIDNDGDLDLLIARIVGSGFGGQNVLLENNGLGAFTDVTATQYPTAEDNSQDAEFADLNNDGYLDLVVANSFASVDAMSSADLLLNQGASNPGVFVEDPGSALEISTPADFIRLCVEIADFDSDGDQDLFVGVHDLFLGADQLLLLNDGGQQGGTVGSFTRQFWFDPGDFISYGLTTLDIENDGDIDVLQLANGVVTGAPAQATQARLYVNTRQ